MTLKRIALLSASTDICNIRMAEALIQTAKISFPEIKIIYIDVLKYIPAIYRKTYADTYQNVIRRNLAIWGYMYNRAGSPKMTELQFAFNDLFAQGVKRKIKELAPDYILCTHFLPAELLGKVKNEKYAQKYSLVIPDLDVHMLWVQKHIDQFFMPNEQAMLRLADKGVPKEKMKVTGIPVHPMFLSLSQLSKTELRKEFGLNPDKFTIFLMAGGYGIGEVDSVAEILLKEFNDTIQIIAYAEQNEKVIKNLRKMESEYKSNFRFLEFSRKIDKLMAMSDIAMIHGAGIFASECMCAGLPALIINPAPGCEERTAEYLVDAGAAFKVYDVIGLKYKVRAMIKIKKLLQDMSTNMLRLCNPNAAKIILKSILD